MGYARNKLPSGFDHARIEQFWSKVIKQDDGCWIYPGWCGYEGKLVPPRVTVRGQTKVTASRFAYEVTYGDCPEGIQVCHTCDNPRCVNPKHLWLGTNQDNVNDKVAKNRQAWGSKIRQGLTADMVREIRMRYVRGVYACPRLAQIYGVASSTISRIVNRQALKGG